MIVGGSWGWGFGMVIGVCGVVLVRVTVVTGVLLGMGILSSDVVGWYSVGVWGMESVFGAPFNGFRMC